MSLRELYVAKPDQLLQQNSKEAYREVASELHFDVLGIAPEEQLLAFKEDLGTLADRKWSAISWVLPADEASPCWLHRAEDKIGDRTTSALLSESSIEMAVVVDMDSRRLMALMAVFITLWRGKEGMSGMQSWGSYV